MMHLVMETHIKEGIVESQRQKRESYSITSTRKV